MLEAIDRIEQRTRDGKEVFYNDPMIQVWVVHHLEIVGEAAKGLSEAFRKSHSRVPWKEVVRARDRLIHGYWTIELDAIWAIVDRDLPVLKAELNRPH